MDNLLAKLPEIENLSQRSQVLVSAFSLRKGGQTVFTNDDIREVFLDARLKPPTSLPQLVSAATRGNKSALMKLGDGYSLTRYGEEEIQDYLDQISTSVSVPTGTKVLDQISGSLELPEQNAFLAEVSSCLKFRAKRAAMILSWCLVLDHIKQYVFKNKLTDFNSALANRQDVKGLQIKAMDDFLEIKKETIFIEVLKSAGIVTNDVRKILDSALDYRNTCAHPNDIKISESKVVGHIEELTENVIQKYRIAPPKPKKKKGK